MVRHCGLHAHDVALCRRTDHVTRWMFLHVPFDVLPVYKLASRRAVCSSVSTPELIIIRRRESVSSAFLTLASPLLLDVRSGFGAGKKTEPHRTETVRKNSLVVYRQQIRQTIRVICHTSDTINLEENNYKQQTTFRARP